MISSSLDLHRYATGRESRVVTAMTMLKSHLFRQGSVPFMLSCLNTHMPDACFASPACCIAQTSALQSALNPASCTVRRRHQQHSVLLCLWQHHTRNLQSGSQTCQMVESIERLIHQSKSLPQRFTVMLNSHLYLRAFGPPFIHRSRFMHHPSI